MSNLLGFAVARKTSRCNTLAGWLAGGTIQIYDGTRPATADSAITTQTLLVTLTIPDPAGTVSNGVLTGGSIAAALIAATGTAAWARLLDDSDTVIGDVDVGLSASGAFVELDNLGLVEGGYCTVTSLTLAEG